MEIHFNPQLVTPSVKKSKGKTGNKQGRFVADVSSSEVAQESFVASEASSIVAPNLFALQELPPEDVERQKARQHGTALLDQLERIRVALLTGRLPQSALQRIHELMQQNFMQGIHNADVREIINEIEVRAAVEMAKMRREIGQS